MAESTPTGNAGLPGIARLLLDASNSGARAARHCGDTLCQLAACANSPSACLFQASWLDGGKPVLKPALSWPDDAEPAKQAALIESELSGNPGLHKRLAHGEPVGIPGWLLFPALKQGALSALLCLAVGDNPRRPSEHERELLLLGVGMLAGKLPGQGDPGRWPRQSLLDHLKNAQEIARLGSWDWDCSTDEVYWSEQTWRIFGIEPRDGPVPRGYFNRFIDENDQPRIKKAIDDALANGGKLDYTYTITLPDGQRRLIRSLGQAWRDETGKPARFSGVVQDITELHEQEEELRRSNELLLALKHAHSLYLTADNHRESFEVILAALARLTGSQFGFIDEVFHKDGGGFYKRNLAVSNVAWDEESHHLYELMLTNRLVLDNMDNLAAQPVMQRKPVIVQHRADDNRRGQLPPGHPEIDSYLGVPLTHNNVVVGVAGLANRPEGYSEEQVHQLEPLLSACASIIHRKKLMDEHEQMRRQLADSEQRMRALLDSVPDLIFRIDREGRYLEVHSQDDNLLAEERGRIIGLTIDDVPPHEVAANAYEAIEQTLATGQATPISYELAVPSGKHWFEARFAPCGKDEVLAIVRDITEETNARLQLADSEQRYRNIVELATEGIWAMDANYRTTFVNRQMAAMLGYHTEDMLGRPVTEFMLEEDLPLHEQRMQERRRGEDQRYERSFRHKDGHAVTMLVSPRTVYDAKGSFAGSFALFMDITLRKRIERELQESEQLHRGLFASAPGAIAVVQDGKVVLANKAMAQMVGYSRVAEIAGRSVFNFVAPTDHGKGQQRLAQTSSGLFTSNEPTEIKLRRRDGSELLARSVYCQITLHGEPAVLIQGYDITPQRETEHALRESEGRYRSLFNNILDSVFIHKIEQENGELRGRIIAVNDAACETLGFTPAEFAEMSVTDLDASPPPDNWPELEQRLLAGEDIIFEQAHRSKDGEAIPVEVHSRYFAMQGEKIIMSVARDLRERKLAEAALRDSEAKLRGILRAAPAGVGMVVNRMLQWTNRYLQDLLGYSANELLGESALMLYPDKGEFERVGQVKYEHIRQHNIGTVETVWLTKDGRRLDILLSSTPLDKHDYGQGVIFTAIDITGRKAAEAERNRLIEELSTALAEVKTLSGMLPICSSCKKIRDDEGYWNQLEAYLEQHSAAQLTHGICPECAKQLYPEYYEQVFKQDKQPGGLLPRPEEDKGED